MNDPAGPLRGRGLGLGLLDERAGEGGIDAGPDGEGEGGTVGDGLEATDGLGVTDLDG